AQSRSSVWKTLALASLYAPRPRLRRGWAGRSHRGSLEADPGLPAAYRNPPAVHKSLRHKHKRATAHVLAWHNMLDCDGSWLATGAWAGYPGTTTPGRVPLICIMAAWGPARNGGYRPQYTPIPPGSNINMLRIRHTLKTISIPSPGIMSARTG